MAAHAKVFLEEDFIGDWQSRWVWSNWKKKSKQRGTWKVGLGKHYVNRTQNKGLMTTVDNKFYAISTRFEPINMTEHAATGKPLIVQFLVKNEQNWRCAGSYLKLFSSSVEQKTLNDADEYQIMFGPDVCEPDRKTHLIFRYNGATHPMRQNVRPDVDPLSHHFMLILRANQSYELKIDMFSVRKGSLYEDFDFLPPENIKDPAASKPSDWVDERLLLVGREKPEWWDDIPKRIPEPDAVRPIDWDDQTDGHWEAPMMDNPDYRGAWRPERVPNPDYIGKWEHPLIPNPDYRNDSRIGFYDDLGVLGFELWQVRAGTIFDRILITDDEVHARKYANDSFEALFQHEKRFRDAELRASDEEDEEDAYYRDLEDDHDHDHDHDDEEEGRDDDDDEEEEGGDDDDDEEEEEEEGGDDDDDDDEDDDEDDDDEDDDEDHDEDNKDEL